MPIATLKKAEEELGHAPDDIVEYSKKANKAIIEIDLEKGKSIKFLIKI